jgi:holo-[acyl-carrier protein] synthase
MILGIGTDIVDIRQIERDIAQWRIRFTQAECDVCEARDERMAAYATRFAIKEAVMKALGVNDVLGGVGWHEIEVVATKSGRPTVALHGGALLQLADITPEGCEARIDVTASDYFPWAHADCIISARPKG